MIVSADSLIDVRKDYRDKRIVLAHGVFDLLHSGHVRHLGVAKHIGDIVIVALWSDASTTFRKGPDRPVNTVEERMSVIDALKPVDFTFEVPGIGWPDELLRGHIDALEPDTYLVSNRTHPFFGGVAYIDHPSGRTTSIVHDISYAEKTRSSSGMISKIAATIGEQNGPVDDMRLSAMSQGV